MKKRLKRLLCFIVLIIFQIPVTAMTPEELDQSIYAKSAILMDAKSGRVLYEKNGYAPMKNASTTKILTCIVALEQGDENKLCKVSEYAASQPKVRLGMKTNQQFRLKDLLYSLMLESHNDSAVVIAENIAGNVEKFAKLMNDKAKKLGAKHTNFVTPNGLDSEQHKTTAYDLALITKYALSNPRFVEIINCPTYPFKEQSGEKNFIVNNKNAFLSSYHGAYGVKTGFTGGAGYCFVGASQNKTHSLISVVLASGWPPNKNFKWKDTTLLMNYGREEFVEEEVGLEEYLRPVLISRGQQDSVEVKYDSYKTLVKKEDEMNIRLTIPQKIEAPVKVSKKIGHASIYINGKLEKKILLYPKNRVEKITFGYIFERVFGRFSL